MEFANKQEKLSLSSETVTIEFSNLSLYNRRTMPQARWAGRWAVRLEHVHSKSVYPTNSWTHATDNFVIQQHIPIIANIDLYKEQYYSEHSGLEAAVHGLDTIEEIRSTMQTFSLGPSSVFWHLVAHTLRYSKIAGEVTEMMLSYLKKITLMTDLGNFNLIYGQFSGKIALDTITSGSASFLWESVISFAVSRGKNYIAFNINLRWYWQLEWETSRHPTCLQHVRNLSITGWRQVKNTDGWRLHNVFYAIIVKLSTASPLGIVF